MAREIYLLTSGGVPTHRNGELIYRQKEGSKMEISTKTAEIGLADHCWPSVSGGRPQSFGVYKQLGTKGIAGRN